MYFSNIKCGRGPKICFNLLNWRFLSIEVHAENDLVVLQSCFLRFFFQKKLPVLIINNEWNILDEISWQGVREADSKF